jgi:hypothetical protein
MSEESTNKRRKIDAEELSEGSTFFGKCFAATVTQDRPVTYEEVMRAPDASKRPSYHVSLSSSGFRVPLPSAWLTEPSVLFLTGEFDCAEEDY